MENIDDLMRQKFDSDDPGQRFEFREEYWEQAQALLEGDETRRRRRLWLWLALVLGIGLLALLLSWCWNSGVLSQHGQEVKGLTSENIEAQRPMSDTAARISTLNLPSENPRPDHGSTNGQPMEKDHSTVASKAHGQYSKDSATGQAGRFSNAQTARYIPQGRTQKMPLPALNTGVAQNGFATSASTQQSPNQGQASVDAPLLSPNAIAQTSNNPLSNPSQSTLTESAVPTPQISILFLPISPFVLSVPVRVPDLPKVKSVEKTLIAQPLTQPVADKPWSFGLALTGSANQQRDTIGRGLGWALGAFGAYQLNPNWSLMLGVQNRYVPAQGTLADSSNQDFAEQVRYSFGYRAETWKRETRGLYYLEVPLSVHWNKGAWGLEGGAAAGMLWYVSEHTESRVETSLEATKTENRSLLNGSKSGYHQRYFAAFAGASYQLTPRISIMTRGQYRFTPVFSTSAEQPSSKGLGSLELGLRVKLL